MSAGDLLKVLNGLGSPADGEIVRVFPGDHNEDIGRTGFAGLLSETSEVTPRVVESPEAWAPIAVSRGAQTPRAVAALEVFQRWLDEERAALHS